MACVGDGGVAVAVAVVVAVADVISKKNISEKGFRIITNSGKDGNEDVPHFHVHILGGRNLGKMIS